MARFRVPASTMRAYSPRRRVFFRWFRPTRTMVRFSPKSFITSATVPTAARSAYSWKRARYRFSPPRAHHQFQGHPHPGQILEGIGAVLPVGVHHRHGGGNLLLALVMVGDNHIYAQAAGVGHLSTAVMPQSTVIIRRTPCRASSSTASRLTP